MSAEMDKHILKEAAGAFATDGAAVSCERYGMTPSVLYVRTALIFFRG